LTTWHCISSAEKSFEYPHNTGKKPNWHAHCNETENLFNS